MTQFADFVRSGNLAVDPELYEVENLAIDREGVLWDALAHQAPWAGKVLVDLGCGSGFWLSRYREAAQVIGVEPDPDLLERARARLAGASEPEEARPESEKSARGGVEVLAGSAESIPLPDSSVDVVHARFAYFFPHPRFDPSPGLREVARVLRPGGRLVVIDNDQHRGEFAQLLAASPGAESQGRGQYPTRWWAGQGAVTTPVMSSWTFDSAEDLQRVLHLEFPQDVVRPWLRDRAGARRLSYGYLLHTWTSPRETRR